MIIIILILFTRGTECNRDRAEIKGSFWGHKRRRARLRPSIRHATPPLQNRATPPRSRSTYAVWRGTRQRSTRGMAARNISSRQYQHKYSNFAPRLGSSGRRAGRHLEGKIKIERGEKYPVITGIDRVSIKSNRRN